MAGFNKTRAPLTERLAQALVPDRGIPSQQQKKKMDSTLASTGRKKYGKKSGSAATRRALLEENFFVGSGGDEENVDLTEDLASKQEKQQAVSSDKIWSDDGELEPEAVRQSPRKGRSSTGREFSKLSTASFRGEERKPRGYNTQRHGGPDAQTQTQTRSARQSSQHFSSQLERETGGSPLVPPTQTPNPTLSAPKESKTKCRPSNQSERGHTSPSKQTSQRISGKGRPARKIIQASQTSHMSEFPDQFQPDTGKEKAPRNRRAKPTSSAVNKAEHTTESNLQSTYQEERSDPFDLEVFRASSTKQMRSIRAYVPNIPQVSDITRIVRMEEGDNADGRKFAHPPGAERQTGRNLGRRRNVPMRGLEEAMQGLTVAEEPEEDEEQEYPSAFSSSSSSARSLDFPTGREDLIPLIRESNLKKVDTFHHWASEIIKAFDIAMVGEGSFGQVFKVVDKPEVSSKTHSMRDIGGCILKVIPIRPTSGKGSKTRNQSLAKDVAIELRLLKRMDEIHGFTRYRGVYVLEGKMNIRFIDAWRRWTSIPSNESQTDASKPTTQGEKQVWAVVEMDDAGFELEKLGKLSMYQVYDIFWSLTLTLFHAEDVAEFEHRDLHVSNVCVKSREANGRMDIDPTLNKTMTAPPPAQFGFSCLRTTIIDYTLSRALVNPDNPQDVAVGVLPEGIFLGRGRDQEQVWQFETYRRMRDAVNLATTGRRRGQGHHGPNWSMHVPRTNVVWLSYLLKVMLGRARHSLLPQSSVTSAVLQKTLRDRLEATLDVIRVEEVGKVPESAGALTNLAVEKGWLTGEDIEAWKMGCEM